MRLLVIAFAFLPTAAFAAEPTITLTQSELATLIQGEIAAREAQRLQPVMAAAQPLWDRERKAFAPQPPAAAKKP